MSKYSHSFPMILIVFVVAGAAGGFQHLRNLSNSSTEDVYVEDYIQDDPAFVPPNIKKEKLFYTKEISIKQGNQRDCEKLSSTDWTQGCGSVSRNTICRSSYRK